MSSILCLAHYCDTHGPTPLMVTEGLPVGCTSCYDKEPLSSRRPSTSSRPPDPSSDGLASLGRGENKAGSSDPDIDGGLLGAMQNQASKPQTTSSAIKTPPESPRVAALQGVPKHRRDSSFRKTYDENDKRRAIPCENCALTMPKQTKRDAPSAKTDVNGPILRTRKPYERVSAPIEESSPPKSSTSSDSDTPSPSKLRTRTRPMIRATTSSSNSSFNSNASHDHFLDYTSTHEPLASTSFSIVRQSCLRTLSCETLPPSNTQFNTSSPTSPLYSNSPFSSAPSSATTSSGGPIFFGDPLAGYTTAYVFRIPDPNARGRRRVYALMALSTHHERVAMSVFGFLSAKFRDLAAWIQSLAEAELEKDSIGSPRFSQGSTPSSSFLSGRNRGLDGKFAGMSLRAKGLAEIVGLPDFFIELHVKFVQLLIELSCFLGA